MPTRGLLTAAHLLELLKVQGIDSGCVKAGEIGIQIDGKRIAQHAEQRQAVGARIVYLPPYRRDLNPIAFAFAKLKWLLRSTDTRICWLDGPVST